MAGRTRRSASGRVAGCSTGRGEANRFLAYLTIREPAEPPRDTGETLRAVGSLGPHCPHFALSEALPRHENLLDGFVSRISPEDQCWKLAANAQPGFWFRTGRRQPCKKKTKCYYIREGVQKTEAQNTQSQRRSVSADRAARSDPQD